MRAQPYIWTEALGCGEILPPMLASYLHHHNFPIHVFVYREDLEYLPEDNRVIPVQITEYKDSIVERSVLEAAFESGHAGTALLWAGIIQTVRGQNLIHLDADTVFTGNVIDLLLRHKQNTAVVGSRRPYRNSSARKGIRKLQLRFRPDAVNTHCFLFDPDFLEIDETRLVDSILAKERKFIDKIFRPVIDFFDPVTFQLRKTGGIYYMDSVDQRKHGSYSREGNLESRMISFSAVGSGSSIYKGKSTVSSETYREFALQSYALYSKYLLDKPLNTPVLDSRFLIEKLNRLNKTSWSLEE
jgi:hypothetical protein